MSHFTVPAQGDMIKNTNPGCKHFGSEGSVENVKLLPDDMGHVIIYTVTNDGPTYRKGDMLTKTLDQLEMIDSDSCGLNEHMTDRNVLREWFRGRLENLLKD